VGAIEPDDMRFSDTGIEFPDYPFPPASVHGDPLLRYADIRDVDPSTAPPEVRTRGGETLFVSATHADALRDAVAKVGLRVARRLDVWDLLLEPFLDTTFDAAHQERTLRTLEAVGVSRPETERIRARVGPTMLAYNGVLWDWVHLGLYDLLSAMRWPFTGEGIRNRVLPSHYRSFYWEAMEIAERGPTEAL
jgi:hypothetical protein